MPDFGDAFDEAGTARGRHSYEGTVDPLAPSVANGGITPEAWEQYKRQRRKAAVIGYLTTIGGMGAAGVGAAALNGTLTGASAGAGAGAASAAPEITFSTAPFAGTASVTAPAAAAGVGSSAATTAAGTGAATVASTSRFPTIANIASKGIEALLGMRVAGNHDKVEREKLAQDLLLAQMADKRARDIAADDNALEESKLDPYRTLNAQIAAAQRMDRLLNTQPLELDFSASRPGSFAPVVRGGVANYRPSGELTEAAMNARTAMLTGTGANGPATSTSRGLELLDLMAGPPQRKGLFGDGRQPVNTTLPVSPPGQRLAPELDELMLGRAPVDPLTPTFDTMPARRRPLRRRTMARAPVAA